MPNRGERSRWGPLTLAAPGVLRAYLLLDVSRSMEYRGGRRLSKIDYAKMLCASLAYLMLLQRDSVGLMSFAEKIRHFVPPRAKVSHLEAITDGLAQVEFGRDTRFDFTMN